MQIKITILSLFLSLQVFSFNKIDSLDAILNHDTTSYKSKLKVYNFLAGRYNRSSLDSSLYYADKSLKLSSQHKYYVGMCKACLNKAFTYGNFLEKDKATESYKMAYQYVEQTEDNNLKAMVMLNYGIHLLDNGQFEEALKWLEQTKTFSDQNRIPDWSVKALNSIGNTYMKLTDYSKAQVAFLEALEINKQLNNDFFETVITNNIGNIYFYLSNYEKAIEYYYLSLEIAEKIDHNFFIQTAYNNIGLIYKELKKYDEAILNITASIEYYLSQNDLINASNAYNTMGLAYFEDKQYDSALVYLNKALKYKNEIPDSLGMAMVYNNIGSLYIKTEHYDLANKNLNIALKLANIYSDNYNKTLAYLSLGELYLEQNQNQGLDYHLKAIELAEKHKLNDASIEAYHNLYEYYKSKDLFDNALEYYEKYTVLSDSIHSEEGRLRIEDIETKYEVDKKDQEILMLQKEQEIKDLLLKTEQEKSQSQRTILILIIGIISIGGSFVALWVRNKQKQKINQLEKRGLKVETDMLRSQMNPHFIFNSLNSIQSFISESDTLDAERYLSKFAQLMRLILDNSRQSYIALEDEINTLKLYLELEQLRFDKRFDYQININNIDDEFTLVPPMLAQPYVENAILHGLASKTDGLININYQQTENKITCTIDDNGIGRKQSESLKQNQNTKKSSLGIKVTQERIDLLAEEEKIQLNIEIEDKYDSDGSALGTKVLIEMPAKE